MIDCINNSNANFIFCETKSKNNGDLKYKPKVDEYVSKVCSNITNKTVIPNRFERCENECNKMNLHLTFKDYKKLLKINYTVSQLKTIAKFHNLKLTGNKSELISRIYSFLKLSNSIVSIQKIARGYLMRKYFKAHGPGFIKRGLCTNSYDFLSMDELTDITNNQFFSFKDEDGFIYGFDVISFYNLLYKKKEKLKNPYNAQFICQRAINQFRDLLRLSLVLKIDIKTKIEEEPVVSFKKALELRVRALFQAIDELGNYSKPEWFLNLGKEMLIDFLNELIDIWHYRVDLSSETKSAICPGGNPFCKIKDIEDLEHVNNIDKLREILLVPLEKMVYTGIDRDSKSLGALYILGALTLVNDEASTSLPWLYQSMTYSM